MNYYLYKVLLGSLAVRFMLRTALHNLCATALSNLNANTAQASRGEGKHASLCCGFIKCSLLVLPFLLTQQESLYRTFEDNSWQLSTLFCLLSWYLLRICFLLSPLWTVHGVSQLGRRNEILVPMLGDHYIPRINWRKTGVLSLIFAMGPVLLPCHLLFCICKKIFQLILSLKELITALSILKCMYRRGINFGNKKT